jgi:SH3-like domain-containing protein
MRRLFLACLLAAIPTTAVAQTTETCRVIDDYIPVGVEYRIEPEPAFIKGDSPGSRVNVRVGPGSEFTADAYGLVGDYVQVIGQAFSSECETWIKVRFPNSGHEGWIRSDFIGLHYGRGWWT